MIRFTIPGKPQGKGRPRFTKMGHAYTPEKTVAYEKAVGFAARVGMGDMPIFTGPLEVHLDVRLQPVTSASKKAREAMLKGETLPAKKPDLDNLIKGVLDGMNGIVYVDDCQVCRLVVEKRYAEVEGVDVWIGPINKSTKETENATQG